MRFRLLILVLLVAGFAYAGENLAQTEYVGDWEQNLPITDGEISTLSISRDLSVRFTRSFAGGHNEQVFATKAGGLRFVDDLAIVDLHKDDDSLAYKLVLSGWRVGEHRRVFGTMYMYQDGKLFNGLPISFCIDE